MNHYHEQPSLLDKIVQNLESHPQNLPIKKFIIYASKHNLINDIDTLNKIYLKTLVKELYERYITIEDLRYSLLQLVQAFNKKEKYSLIANIIIDEMEKGYAGDKQLRQKILISNNHTAFPVQSASQQKGKLVVLELEFDTVEQQVRAILEIATANNCSHTRVVSTLPSAPKIIKQYESWQSIYRSLDISYRLGAPETQVTQVSFEELFRSCYDSLQLLRSSLTNWYNSIEFSSIREKLFQELDRNEEVRIIIRTRSFRMWQLPWHLFFERFLDIYRQAEIALSFPEYNQVTTLSFPRKKIKVLAILGNSAGINIETDRQTLEDLPNSETLFLVEPNSKQINDALWDQDWNILFFAGHSSSQSKTGHIYINKEESLAIPELKYALREAIGRGLNLAIFNSCDGLKLARELAYLNIPQVIVMREPVPDLVAQEFLKLFLKAFSKGKSLYTAVREARERLQPFEKQFPGATCLPVICQNTATIPLTWQEFMLPLDEQLLEQENDQLLEKQEVQKPIILQNLPTPNTNSQPSSSTSYDWSFKIVIAWLNFYLKFYVILFILLGTGQINPFQFFLLSGILFIGGLESIVSVLYRYSANPQTIAFAQKMFSNIFVKHVSSLGDLKEIELKKNIEKYNEARRIINRYLNQYPELNQHFSDIKEINQTLNNIQQQSINIYQKKKFDREQLEEAIRQRHEQRQKYWDKL